MKAQSTDFRKNPLSKNSIQKSKEIGLSERTDADKNLSAFFPGSAGVSAAHFPALQPLLTNNHASSRSILVDSEIASIRIYEPARRRCSQGRAMRKCKKYAASGETAALPGRLQKYGVSQKEERFQCGHVWISELQDSKVRSFLPKGGCDCYYPLLPDQALAIF
jgi:hypothetical protein